MSRLPLNLPSRLPVRPMRRPLRDTVFFCLSFGAVFVAALLVMEMMLG